MIEMDITKWPAIRTRVTLLSHHWPDWLESRIEDLDDHRLIVAAPSTPTIPFLMPDLGDLIKVHWISHRGICELSGKVDVCKRSPMPTWEITVTSQPTIHQRRRFARIPVMLPVTLTIGECGIETSNTINIGEGGMTCVIGHNQTLAPGDNIEVIVNIDGEAFRAQAVCLRNESNEIGSHSASFRFDQLEPNQADRIRRFIFNEELQRRAQGRHK